MGGLKPAPHALARVTASNAIMEATAVRPCGADFTRMIHARGNR